MIVAIIPARGGSKRIKNKNIINISGKPMIHHTIQILKKTKIFDKIIVTTDSPKIQNISKKAEQKYILQDRKIYQMTMLEHLKL